MYRETSTSVGIGTGRAVIVEEVQLTITRRVVSDVEGEAQHSKGALDEITKATERLVEDLATGVGEKEAETMQGYMMLLADLMLTGEIENSARNDGISNKYAIENVCNMYVDMFASMGDELMQWRATDIRDIKIRMQQMLMGTQSTDISSLPEGSIIAIKDLTPSVTAGIDPANVTDIVTELGGKTSYSAVLARTLEIPAVVAVTGFMDGVRNRDRVVLDGGIDEVYVNPDQATMADYEEKRKQFPMEKKELEKYTDKPPVTKDDVQVEIVASTGEPEDVDKVLQYDREGIGLFRTEFLFMGRNVVPTEEEQSEVCRRVAAAMSRKSVITRTLDIGGDRGISYMDLEKDENSLLGYRAIHFCLDRREDVYKSQLRAFPGASAFGNICIMVPLVTCIEGYRQTKALVEEIKKELNEKGTAYNKGIQVGIMVETVVASPIADIFAKGANSSSIGTNDLTQYTMSADRGNKKMSYLYSTFSPAMLRGIKYIIVCGCEAGIMVGMYSEAASDPVMIPLLLAFRLNEFSMSVPTILKAREMVTQHSVEEFQAVADKAMSFVIAAEIEQYMRDFVERATD